jgi:hypothetical protein
MPCCLWGCQDYAQKKSPNSSNQAAFQRFVGVSANSTTDSPSSGSIALDTQTGQLCTTHAIPDTSPTWAQRLPRCIDLYTDTEKVLALERKTKVLSPKEWIDQQKNKDKK